MSFSFFASAPRGFEDLLEAELRDLGAARTRRRPGGVAFSGGLEAGYRACLWSRLAEHVLVELNRFQATTPEALYQGAGGILWREHTDPSSSFAVTFAGRNCAFRHSHFAALKVKDAVVDQFRAATGERPPVDLNHPDLRIHAFAERDQVTLSIDLAGEALHRRGYRVHPLEAPVKETLAAGILMRGGWPRWLAAGGALVDPMCGSGTFLVEAAWMALDRAPGSLRRRFGFHGWRRHDEALWRSLCEEAQARAAGAQAESPPIVGFDADAQAVTAAAENLARAGVEGRIRLETRALEQIGAVDVPGERGGLVVTNPPYGERLSAGGDLDELYRSLGDALVNRFSRFDAVVLAGESAPVHAIGRRTRRSHRVFNGPIRCRLLRYQADPLLEPPRPGEGPPPQAEPAATDFANRLAKNLRRLNRWARRNDIQCFRVYDADVPEYALAVDLYQGRDLWAHVQEYAAPPSIDAGVARRRLDAALAAIPAVLGIPAEQVVFKRRQRQRGRHQYQRLDVRDEFIEVTEGGCRFLVNLKDRIDTGLYLDHRPLRMMVRALSGNRRFLNLFAYTGAASVHAAAGGAHATLSIDLSATYGEWAGRNFDLNGMRAPAHRVERADCLEWIARAPESGFGLALLDPPTFSNSKSMQRSLDVQRDHPELIRSTMRLLSADGILLFSNHARRFRMNAESLGEFHVEDISAETIPEDFLRSPNIHGCWRITHR